MPAKVSDERRRAVLDDVRAGLLTQGEVSRKHGVSRASVSKWAAGAGVESPRSGMVAAAVEAQQWDRALWRARVAEKAAVQAERLLDRMGQVTGGRDVQAYSMAVKILIESVDLLMPAVSEHADAKGLLSDLAHSLGIGFGAGAASQNQDILDSATRPTTEKTTADQGEAGESTP